MNKLVEVKWSRKVDSFEGVERSLRVTEDDLSSLFLLSIVKIAIVKQNKKK